MKVYVATKVKPHWKRAFSARARVWNVIKNAGAAGVNRRQIADALHLDPNRVSGLVSELRRQGLIETQGEPGTVHSYMNATEAAHAALVQLEAALVAKVREMHGKIPAETEREFGIYQKIKELALRPGTGPEGQVALYKAIQRIVKIVYTS